MTPTDLYSTKKRSKEELLALYSPENMCPEDRAFYNYMQSGKEAHKKMLEHRKKIEEERQKKAEEAKLEKEIQKQLEEQLDKKLGKELEKALASVLKELKF